MKIQIFLASSITEFKIDRLNIVQFVNKLNKIYHKEKSEPDYDEARDLFFHLDMCEDDDESVARGPKQGVFDKQILDSDFVYFLFGEKVGKYTKHEFNVAYNGFKLIDKPRIFIYARVTTDTGMPISKDSTAQEFDTLIREEIEHFYGKYEHIDTVLYKMAMNIIAMGYPTVNVSVKDGTLVDGSKSILSLKNVPAWRDNDALLNAPYIPVNHNEGGSTPSDL